MKRHHYYHYHRPMMYFPVMMALALIAAGIVTVIWAYNEFTAPPEPFSFSGWTPGCDLPSNTAVTVRVDGRTFAGELGAPYGTPCRTQFHVYYLPPSDSTFTVTVNGATVTARQEQLNGIEVK